MTAKVSGREVERRCAGNTAHQSVLEKLIRLSLTNKLTDDQKKAVVALGHQLFQTSSLTSAPCRSWTDPLIPCEKHRQSEASVLADTVVQETVRSIRDEVAAHGAATAVQRSSTSMLADSVVQHTVHRIHDELTAVSSATAPQPTPTTSILAETVVRECLEEIANDPATSAVSQATITESITPDKACSRTACTELTKYIVMNAIDIARSCSRRAATKRAETEGRESPVSRLPAPGDRPASSIIDAFVDLLSNEVHGNLTRTARRPTPDAILAASRWIDEDLRRQCLCVEDSSSPAPLCDNPFADVLLKLAVHDRLGDLQANFVDGREMIELATCVLKSHAQLCTEQHGPDDVHKTTSVGNTQQPVLL